MRSLPVHDIIYMILHNFSKRLYYWIRDTDITNELIRLDAIFSLFKHQVESRTPLLSKTLFLILLLFRRSILLHLRGVGSIINKTLSRYIVKSDSDSNGIASAVIVQFSRKYGIKVIQCYAMFCTNISKETCSFGYCSKVSVHYGMYTSDKQFIYFSIHIIPINKKVVSTKWMTICLLARKRRNKKTKCLVCILIFTSYMLVLHKWPQVSQVFVFDHLNM